MAKQTNLNLETNWVIGSAETLGLQSSTIGLLGARELTVAHRELYKTLLRNATGSDDPRNARYFTVDMDDLEEALGSRDDVIRSIVALMQTIIVYRDANGSVSRVQLLARTTTPADHLPGDLRYSISDELRALIWGDLNQKSFELAPEPQLMSPQNAKRQEV